MVRNLSSSHVGAVVNWDTRLQIEDPRNKKKERTINVITAKDLGMKY